MNNNNKNINYDFDLSNSIWKATNDICCMIMKCYKYLSSTLFMYDKQNVKVSKIINRFNNILVIINSGKIDYEKIIINYDIICHYCIGDSEILSLHDLSTFRKDLDALKGGDSFYENSKRTI